MKKLLLLVIVLPFLVSCGPHRMSCGARGICEVSIKKIVPKSKINHNSQIVKNELKNPVPILSGRDSDLYQKQHLLLLHHINMSVVVAQ